MKRSILIIIALMQITYGQPFFKQGGLDINSVDNGIEFVGSKAGLGGSLNRNTSIATSGNVLQITGLPSNPSASAILVQDGTGKLGWIDKSTLEIPYSGVFVWFNAIDPNVATIFDTIPNPTVNNPTYQANTDYLYVGTNNKSWQYIGSGYVEIAALDNTPFMIATTTSDAGGNKNDAIYRYGRLGLGHDNPQSLLDIRTNASDTEATIQLFNTATTPSSQSRLLMRSFNHAAAITTGQSNTAKGEADGLTIGVMSNTEDISFKVGDAVTGTASAYPMILQHDGNLGIGVNTATNALHVKSNSDPLRLVGLTSGSSTDSILTVSANGVVKMQDKSRLIQDAWTVNGNSITSGKFIGTTNNEDLIFKRNDVESGLVGEFDTKLGYQSNIGSSSFGSSYNTVIGSNSSINNNSYWSTVVGANSLVNTDVSETSIFGAYNTANAAGVLVGGGITVDAGSDGSTAIGSGVQIGVTSPSPYSVGLGIATATNAYNATAIGSYSRAEGNNSTAIGNRSYSTQPNTLILGSVNGQNGATSNVNVGIGTTTPATALHVATTTAGNFGIRVESSDLSGSDIGYETYSYLGQEMKLGHWNNAVQLYAMMKPLTLGTATAQSLIFQTSSATRMQITGAGNVGIGVAPTSKLHLVEAGAKTVANTGVSFSNTSTSSTASISKIGLSVTSTGTWNGPGSSNVGLSVNATGGAANYAATFMGGGVGIGTTSPTASLSVIQPSSSSTNTAVIISNPSTTTTAAQSKFGLSIASTGAWTGVNCINTGVNVNVSGGTINYAALFNGGNVGIGTLTPNSTFHVDGSESSAYLSIISNVVLGLNQRYVVIPLGSAFTVTLPAATAITGRVYTIANKSAAVKTIGNYVNLSGATVNTLAASTSIELISDGANWQQVR